MATAAALPGTAPPAAAPRLKKGATRRAHVEQWQNWKAAGNAPATRTSALAVLSAHIKGLGSPASLKREFMRLKMAHGRAGEDGEQLNDSLSFIVWDITANSGRAMNYGTHSNFFQGLIQQATNLIYTYTRVNLKIGKITVSMPTVVYTQGKGAMRIADISASSLQNIADDFVDDAKVRMLRWKTVGADATFIKRTLRKLMKAVLAEV